MALRLGFGGLGLEAAGLNQSGSLANAGMANQVGLANMNALNQVGMGNQDAWLRGQTLNMEGANMANQTNVQGANAIAGAANIPVQNLQGIYNVGQTVQQAPWQQLGQYADIFNPYAQLAQTQLGKTTTQQQMGRGQILGGLASLGLGAATGGLIPGIGAMAGGALGGWGSGDFAGAQVDAHILQCLDASTAPGCLQLPVGSQGSGCFCPQWQICRAVPI